MCTLLDAALGRTPNAVLRSKAGPSSAILNSILERHGQEACYLHPPSLLSTGSWHTADAASHGHGVCRCCTSQVTFAQPFFYQSCLALQATVVRPALGSLGQVTAAVEPVEWPSAARPFAQLLRYSLDGRPKVRKRAQAAVLNVLAAAQGTAALPSASEAVLKGDHHVLWSVAACRGTNAPTLVSLRSHQSNADCHLGH